MPLTSNLYRVTVFVRAFVACALVLVCGGAARAATISVPSGGNLQAALNSAQPGDTILLAPGATFTGNFILPVKSGSATITIRSAADDSSLPPANARMDPSFAAQLPKLRSGNTAPALATAAGAHHYILMFLEFLGNAQGAGDIIALGDGSTAQNALSLVPHDLVVDRVYVHGDATIGQKRGIGLNSASTTITGTYIAEIKIAGQDSQAIAGWNGPGPYTITNNYLEAAGENIIFGGSDPAIPNLVTSDITIRNNYLTKQLAWRGQSWVVKNLFELKNAQRVVVDGNVMEYSWLNGQVGFAVQLTVRNQDGGCPWCVVQDVQFTNNMVRHVGSGINILGKDNNHPSQITNNIVVRNNVFEDVSGATYGGYGRFFQIGEGAVNVTVDHNTVLQDGTSALYAYGAPMPGFVFTNNIVPDNSWAIMGGNASPGNGTIAMYFPNPQFANGVFAGSNPATYPQGNYYPAWMSAVGFENLTGGNYRLSATSAFHNAATDGTDVGCNIDALNVALLPPPVGPPTMTAPATGAALSGTSETFRWTAGSGVQQFWLDVGTVIGGNQIYAGTQGLALSRTVTGLPINGQPIYARLWLLTSSGWSYTDYTYAALLPLPAGMTSPAPGATLGGSAATFTWTGGTAVSQIWLDAGTTPGGNQIYAGSQGLARSRTLTGLPANGQPIYIRLWSLTVAGWSLTDYTYTAVAPVPAGINTPAPNSTLGGSTVAFSWTSGTAVSQIWLDVGTTVGGNQIYAGSQGVALGRTVTGLPTNGQLVYVRLWSLTSAGWSYTDYTYTTATPVPAGILTPAPNTTLAGSTATFAWTRGTAVSQIWLDVGTTPGGNQIYAGTQGVSQSRTIAGLPTNGLPVHVRLWSLSSAGWGFTDYTYTAALQ